MKDETIILEDISHSLWGNGIRPQPMGMWPVRIKARSFKPVKKFGLLLFAGFVFPAMTAWSSDGKGEERISADILPLWNAPMPKAGVSGAGFKLPDGVKHATVFVATQETGGYNHHPKLTWHDGKFHAMWSNHPYDEEAPGERILYSQSTDGISWSSATDLFPPEGPYGKHVYQGDGTGYVSRLASAKWLVHEGELYALAHSMSKHTILARSVDKVSNFGPIFSVMPEVTSRFIPSELTVLPCDDPSIASTAKGLYAMLRKSPEQWTPMFFRLQAIDPGELQKIRKANPGVALVEPTGYRKPDGTYMMLFRDDKWSHRIYALRLDEKGHIISPLLKTNIPDTPSLTTNLRLSDGRILLIGNQVAPKMDNPDEIRHYDRDPLVVTVSSADASTFDTPFALRSGCPPMRISGVTGRGPGFQYPSAIVHNGRLYVLYSVNKEDIAISSVPLAALGVNE
jgi:hypothetical protein